MVEVFKTNIADSAKAKLIRKDLVNRWPDAKINFDLEDCDNILRIEGAPELFHRVSQHLIKQGYRCEALQD